jgi:hypothetical protein
MIKRLYRKHRELQVASKGGHWVLETGPRPALQKNIERFHCNWEDFKSNKLRYLYLFGGEFKPSKSSANSIGVLSGWSEPTLTTLFIDGRREIILL